MSGKGLVLVSAALLALGLAGYADQASGQVTRAATQSSGAFSGTKDRANAAPVAQTIRIPPLPPPTYHSNIGQAASGFTHRPSTLTLRIIDSDTLKLEWRVDAQGHWPVDRADRVDAAILASGP